MPFISGKDSLKNEFHAKGKSIVIPPTLLISAIGIVQDVRQCVTMDMKKAGNKLFLVGRLTENIGGSQYAKALQLIGGMIFFNTKGNDFMVDRNIYTTVDYFTNQKMDIAQHMTAFGLKCNFSAKSYITGLFQSASYQDKLLVMPDYTMKQFLLIYNMTF